MNTRNLIIIFLLIGIVGAGITGAWFIDSNPMVIFEGKADVVILSLIIMAGLTTVNLFLRWVRWHYIVRTMGIRLVTKESLVLYFATLPAIFTPLSVGELVRGLALTKRFQGSFSCLGWTWVLERMTDAAVLLLFWSLATATWAVSALLLVCYPLLVLIFAKSIGLSERGQSHYSHFTFISRVITASLLSWLLPILGLYTVLVLFGAGTGVSVAAQSFSQGVLLGGISGIPLGTGVSGSNSIFVLLDHGIVEPVAVAVVLILRIATAWYAVALGSVVFVCWRKYFYRLVRRTEDQQHFDDLAEGYTAQIPEHMREQFLSKKINTMDNYLRGSSRFSGNIKGLDLGCGQGWYASAMTGLGYEMKGADLSEQQVRLAKEYAAGKGQVIDFSQASAADIPFDDNQFDFIYSINALHHITDDALREKVFSEITRVLKPGGVFFLHEMNTENPLFNFYMSYVFPLINDIDEGTEVWIKPTRLPQVDGAAWQKDVVFFTFMPDFMPSALLKLFAPVERKLEQSRFNKYSAHYVAILEKMSNP